MHLFSHKVINKSSLVAISKVKRITNTMGVILLKQEAREYRSVDCIYMARQNSRAKMAVRPLKQMLVLLLSFCDINTAILSSAPSTRIRIRLYPQTFCCGFKTLRVHTYPHSLRFRASTRIRENDTNTL